MNFKYILLQVNLIFVFTRLICALQWRTSDWTPCVMNKTCSEIGYKRRNVTCFDTDKQVDFTLCKLESTLSAQPKSFTNCIPDECVLQHKQMLKLVRTGWSACTQTKDFSFNNTDRITEEPTVCGKNSDLVVYVRERRMECRFHFKRDLYITLESSECSKLLNVAVSTATERQLCYSKCVRECAFTLWRKWKRCFYCRENIKYKTRTHASLPEDNAHCGSQLRVRARLNKERPKEQYRVSGWRQVSILYHNKNWRSKFSIYNRDISCVDIRGQACARPDEASLSSHQVQVSDRDCKHTEWGKWSLCNPAKRSIGHQYRTREIFSYPLGNGKSCGVTTQQRLCDANSNSKTRQFEWREGDWSSCKIDHLKSLEHESCEIKKQHRSVYCTSSDDPFGKPLNSLYCDPRNRPKSQQICHVTCPSLYCVYGEWDRWENCSRGLITRNRALLHGSPQSCLLTAEKRFCNVAGPLWVREPNSICNIYTGDSCGEGTVKYRIVCKEDEKILNDSLCDPVTRPADTESCSVPCKQGIDSRKCVLSTWSNWTPCTSGLERHTRSFLFGSEANCGNIGLVEERKCTKYFWIPSSWGDCELMNKTADGCEVGLQTKQFICVEKERGRVVKNSKCKQSLNYTAFPETRKCVACNQACVLSMWSDWDPDCSEICTPFTQEKFPQTKRVRYILKNDNGNCSHKLIETKICQPCLDYKWEATKWDVCTHNNAPTINQNGGLMDMRNGYQIRNVFCSDGVRPVADSLCPERKPVESRDCHIDWLVTCNLKPWSDWSECDDYCGNGKWYI